MSLKVGSLFVSLDAQTTGFMKGLEEAFKGIEKFSRNVKKAASEIAQLSTALTGVGLAALKLAESSSGPVQAAMDDMTKATKQLAIPVAEMLVPAVKSLTEGFRELARHVSGLSPETKAQIATWAQWVAGIGAAAFVVSKLAGVISGLAGVFSAVFGAIAAIGAGPLALILVALGGLAAAIAALHYVWRKDVGGMATATKEFLDWFGPSFRVVFLEVGRNMRVLASTIIGSFSDVLHAYGVVLQYTGKQEAALKIFGAAARIHAVATSALDPQFWKDTVTAALDLGKQAATAFVDEWKRIMKELGIDELLPKFKGKGELPTVFDPNSIIVGGKGPSTTKIDTSTLTGLAPARAPEYAVTGHPNYGIALNDYVPFSRMQVPDELTSVLSRHAQRTSSRLDVNTAGIGQAIEQLTSRLGELGSVVSATVQGFRSGGLAGGLAALLGELLLRSSGFARLVDQANGVVMQLVSAVEPMMGAILPGLQKLLAAVTGLVSSALEPLQPVFELLGSVLESLAPLFLLLGTYLRALAPIITLVIRVAMIPMMALKPLIEGLFVVLRPILQGLTWFVGMIADIWNSIIGALAGAVTEIIKAITVGVVTNGGDFLLGLQVDAAAIHKANSDLAAMTLDSANATLKDTAVTQEHAGATERATAAVRKFVEELTNAPSGFKRAMYAFAADNGVDEASIAAMMASVERRQAVAATGNPAGTGRGTTGPYTGTGGSGAASHGKGRERDPGH